MKKYLLSALLAFWFSSVQADCLTVSECMVGAENGDAIAQVTLGNMYSAGNDVVQDNVEAMKWYLKAAEQGNPAAQFNLGAMYDAGKAVMQDYNEAMKWYLKAAEQGFPIAQLSLAMKYEKGKAVAQDYDEAMKWYLKAAEQGNFLAHLSLGSKYRYGNEYVEKDYVMSHMWFNIAVANGYSDASSKRDSVAEEMTSSQIAEAQTLAREWMANHP